jgi:crotonobetainyl-CoA:carnitine CoA-transferase CaiB-like acyl-CoA transferase
MAKETASETALGPYRVLDLTDEKGLLCGMLLAGLGADVIKVERPGGDLARNIGPFYDAIPHPEKSLLWFAYNLNKKGITLNIETVDGREIFKRLVKTSDFVIESFPPGYMARLGLDYSALTQINPRIIMTSITPFGQTGPYRDYKGSDLICMASGGLMYVSGDPDRPPVRITIPQAYCHAGAHAAAAMMIAHYYRQITGKGQYIDVSVAESVAWLEGDAVNLWSFDRFLTSRAGPRTGRGRLYMLEVWPCKDGEVCFRILGGVYGRGIRPMAEWAERDGMAGALKEVKDWQSVDMSKVTQDEMERWEKAFRAFFAQKTKAELFEEAKAKHIYLMPSNTPKDLAEDEQLAARNYWVEVDHRDHLGATVIYPGAPFMLSLTPWKIQRRPPLIGEHNVEILEGELGLSKQELEALKASGVI